MNQVVLDNGDKQVGDYKFRINQGYTNVVFIITEGCNFRCSYCLRRSNATAESLTDKYTVGELVDHFRYLQDSSGKKLYICLTGGEPSLVTNFGNLVRQLTYYMDMELQTNLSTKYIKDFATNANPERVGQVMASYHGETLDKNDSLRRLYFENFRLLMEQGFTVVLKTVAVPEEIPQLRDKVAWLKTQLPDKAIIFVQPFIAGRVWQKEHPSSYPYLYTEEGKRMLQEVMQVRRAEIFDYINGAGWFPGMKCDAGRGFMVMDTNGDAFRCSDHLSSRRAPLGNLLQRNLHLLNAPRPCPAPYCSTPFWGLWYGVNPWDYIGKKAEDCQYCRFAPLHLASTEPNLELAKERELYGKDRLDIPSRRKGITAYINTFQERNRTRKATADRYRAWAYMLNSAKDYKCAMKYVLKSFFLNPFSLQTLSLVAILFLPEKIVEGVRKINRILLRL